MALGKQNTNTNKLYILKIRTTDSDKKPIPVKFDITEKVGEKWEVTGETKDVSGALVKVETYEKTFEKVTTPRVKLWLEDNEKQESYMLDLTYNMLSRNLFNCILNLKDFSDVKIGVWERKVEDKTYPAVSVRSNDQKVDWAFRLDEIPKPQKVKVGKTEVTNFDELNDFFVEKLQKFTEVVKNAAKPVSAKPKKSAAPEVPLDVEDTVESEDDLSQIPF